MKIALDTNIICKACDLNDPNMGCVGVMTKILHDTHHAILHDTDGKLIDEYRNNAGEYKFFIGTRQKTPLLAAGTNAALLLVSGNSQIIIYHPPVLHTGLLIDDS